MSAPVLTVEVAHAICAGLLSLALAAGPDSTATNSLTPTWHGTSWAAEVQTSRVHFRVTLRRAEDRLTGAMIDLPSSPRIREIALKLVR